MPKINRFGRVWTGALCLYRKQWGEVFLDNNYNTIRPGAHGQFILEDYIMADTKTISQLNQEIKQLKAMLTALEPEKQPKATVSKGVCANENYMQQPVTIKLFKDNGRYRDDVYVAVNDRSYLIRRGVEVTVPRFIEQALKNSLAQDEYVASFIDGLVNDYERSTLRQGV